MHTMHTPKYRIVEISHNGRVWYEVQKGKRESDMRGETWETWTPAIRPGVVNEHATLEAARQFRDALIASHRVVRVVE